jgi:hypothetical protein
MIAVPVRRHQKQAHNNQFTIGDRVALTRDEIHDYGYHLGKVGRLVAGGCKILGYRSYLFKPDNSRDEIRVAALDLEPIA